MNVISSAMNGLRGYIPSELSYLDRLRSIELDDNAIAGTIPMELASLIHLGK